jgi:hypothetical protein
MGYGRQQLAARGLDNDPYNLMSAYTSRIGSKEAGLQDLGDLNSVYGNSVWDEVYGEQRNLQRNTLGRKFDTALPTDRFDTEFGATSDDDILEAILGTQYETASNDLLNAKNRGQMNDNAYSRATQDLTSRRSAARSELEDLGLGVLSGYRTELGGQRTKARDSINNWDFGDTFDIDREVGRLDSEVAARKQRKQGDINRAVGDKKFFDTNTLIGRANAAGGATNPGTAATGGGGNPLYTAFTDQAQRNLGGEGVF